VRGLLAVVLLLLASAPLLAGTASGETATVTVRSPAEVALLVNRETFYSRSLAVPVGSEVCVVETVVYADPGTRYVFTFWTHEAKVVSKSKCVKIEGAGAYEAVYKTEYLVTVFSEPPIFSTSFWVSAGSTFNYTAPAEVVSGGVLYRFSRWEPLALGYNVAVSFAVTQPAVVRAVYTPYYPLYIDGELAGYYPAGYVYVYKPKSTQVAGVMQVAEGLTVVGSSYTPIGGGAYAVVVNGPTYVFVSYATYYRVTVKTPQGEKEHWVREGETFTENAPQTVDLGGERLVFKRWAGDVETESPTLTFKVEKPVHVEAVYTKQYRVVVVAPTGEKTRYVDEGGTLYHYEPPELPAVLLSRVLTKYLVDGSPYTTIAPGVLKVGGVSKPLTVVAVYEYRVKWENAALISAFMVLAVVAYTVATTIARRGTKIL